MWRTISPPAVPCAYRPQAALEMPSRSGPKRRDSGTRPVLAVTFRRKPSRAPRQRPTNRIPCPEASAPMPDSMPHAFAPLIRNTALALLGRAGSHAGGLPARAATLFRVLRPMRSAREQREKLTSGCFYFHARLRFLPCRHARAACDSRGARHATGAGLRV